MGQTILYNKGFDAGAVAFFLVAEKGVGFIEAYEAENIDSPAFNCGYEAGFQQYM